MKLRHGDLRCDGFVFWGYKKRRGKIEESWCSPDVFVARKAKARIQQRERARRPEVRAAQIASNRARKDYYAEYWRCRRASDPNARIAHTLRKRVQSALKLQRNRPKSIVLLGCSIEDFRAHLEKRFLVGMRWENYGLWEVDHILPIASFDLRCPAQQICCFHYSNCQPLWLTDNRRKGSKAPEPFTERNI